MCIINCYLTLPYLHYYMFDKILQTRELEMKTYIPYNLNNMNKIHPQVNIFIGWQSLMPAEFPGFLSTWCQWALVLHDLHGAAACWSVLTTVCWSVLTAACFSHPKAGQPHVCCRGEVGQTHDDAGGRTAPPWDQTPVAPGYRGGWLLWCYC